MYKLEVEQEHQFYVGETGVLVHNGYVTGLRNRDAFKGMAVTGETEGGLNRVSAAWREEYGPSAMREHHLVPQEMLENPSFMQQMRTLGYTDAETVDFVHRQIAELPNANHIQAHAEGWNQTWRD